jgi:hypothetical protein
MKKIMPGAATSSRQGSSNSQGQTSKTTIVAHQVKFTKPSQLRAGAFNT